MPHPHFGQTRLADQEESSVAHPPHVERVVVGAIIGRFHPGDIVAREVTFGDEARPFSSNGGEFVRREEFVGRVQQRTGLASSREAEATTRATLITLGEYLSGGEGLDLASQLPQGLKEHLRRQPPDRSEIFL